MMNTQTGVMTIVQLVVSLLVVIVTIPVLGFLVWLSFILAANAGTW